MNFRKMSQEDRLRYPIYAGDRILVSKFAYDFSDPRRWDVIVFKFPEDAKTNYIKRLVGLPNKVMRIRDGDIAVTAISANRFTWRRKTPPKCGRCSGWCTTTTLCSSCSWPRLASPLQNSQASGTAQWTNEKTSAGSEDPKTFVTEGKRPDGKRRARLGCDTTTMFPPAATGKALHKANRSPARSATVADP